MKDTFDNGKQPNFFIIYLQVTKFKGCDAFTNWQGQHFEATTPSLSTWINGANYRYQRKLPKKSNI